MAAKLEKRSMTTRILLADGHQLFRHSLRALLEGEGDLVVVGQAEDGQDLLDLLAEVAADVVCLDVDMSRMNGVVATRRIRAEDAGVRVIALSDRIEWPVVRDMMDAGADGYVSKCAGVEDLLQAIRGKEQGRRYFCRHVTASVLDAVFDNKQAFAAAPALTDRERQVLALIADGLSSAAIAQRLGISQATVRGYRAHLMRELDLHNVAALTKYAIGNGVAGANHAALQ